MSGSDLAHIGAELRPARAGRDPTRSASPGFQVPVVHPAPGDTALAELRGPRDPGDTALAELRRPRDPGETALAEHASRLLKPPRTAILVPGGFVVPLRWFSTGG